MHLILVVIELPLLKISKMINGVSGKLSERPKLLIGQGTPNNLLEEPWLRNPVLV